MKLPAVASPLLLLGLFPLAPHADAAQQSFLGGGIGGRGAFSWTQRIDFEQAPAGAQVSSVTSTGGFGPVLVSGANPLLPGANAAILFDSSNPTGGDFDLGTPNEDFGGPGIGAGGGLGSPFVNQWPQGNLLIVAADLVDADGDQLVDDPDDAENAGTSIELDFAAIHEVDLESITVIDFEPKQTNATITLFDPAGASVGTYMVPTPGDNGVTTIDFTGVQRVRRAVIWLDGSGAIDDIRFNPLNIGRIGDTVWCDENNDGIRQIGEPGIPGVRIDLRCAGLDGVLDTADDTFADTVTNANGRYQFTGLLPGLCRVTVDTTTVPATKVPGLCPLVHEVDLIPFGIYRKADFCFVEASARLGDFVWCDTNDDGIQDPLEPGIPNVGVRLQCAGADGLLGTGDDLFLNTTTDPSGFYIFEDLAPDLCAVTVDPLSVPADKTQGSNCPTAYTLTLGPGDEFLDADFCYIPNRASLGDFVWCDEDDDGVQDPGEPGIGGVEVTLTCAGPDLVLGTVDDVIRTQLTDANGLYLFTDIAPGTCRASVDLTAPPANKIPGSNCPPSVTTVLAPGESFLEADFCFITPGEIGDLVWCDLDNDGVFDVGEPGLANATVELTCAGGDGLIGTADDIIDSTVTDANGLYLFTGIPAGLCLVSVDSATIPAGKVPGICPTEYTINLPVGGAFLDADFCFITPGEVGDFVWCDENNNGLQDPGEPGIAGVSIELRCAGPDGALDTADDVVASTVTNAFGLYLFTDVYPDTCVARVDPATAPSDKEVGVCPIEVSFTLAPSQSFLDADFCFRSRPAALGDFVWCDLDNDGLQDPGEPGIEGALVELRCAGIDNILNTADDLVDSTSTDAAGAYLFDPVPPGLCLVQVQPSSVADKVPGICPTEVILVLQPGQSFLDADFCFIEPPIGSIGDFVWCDENDDGIQDPGEPGIGGVRVNLRCAGPDTILNTPDDVLDSTLTGPSGMYLFEDVPAGRCIASVDPSSAPTPKVPGTSCPLAYEIDLAPGDAFLQADFCFVDPPARLGDTVFCDLDNDGFQDVGEPGIAGVRVDLRCAGPDDVLGTADDLLDSQTTDGNGQYLFVDLAADQCEVTVDVNTALPKIPGICPTAVVVNLQPGDEYLDADFCFVELSAVGDFVWCDIDDDGVQDPNEPGVPGITIELLCAGPDQILGTPDDIGDQMVTDANGFYLFSDLLPGPCVVTMDQATIPATKELGVCPPQVTVALQPGQSYLDADFCIRYQQGGDCCADGRPRSITLLYTGRDCSATVTTQPSDKWSCAGDPGFAQTVFVRSSDDDDPFETDADVWFEGAVTLNSEFVIDTANAGEDRFDSRTYVHVFDPTGTVVLQSVEFHTSCSQPLCVGDQYGSMRIVSCIGENTPIPGDCCANGRPASLTFIYTGESCAATSHFQDPGKVECSGDPASAQTVYIFAKDDDHAFHSHGKVWFQGIVNLNEPFVLSAQNAGEDRLENETFIHIFDPTGATLLQTVEFHTSCSQPLAVGNQFGASLLVDCTGENEPVPGDCCAFGKPRQLTFTYTGESCAATSTTQDPGKVECSGDPAGRQTVWIVAKDDDDFQQSSGHLWFEGPVTLGEDFVLDAANAGENRLKNETFIAIFDVQGGTILQELEFHTSCSQPLFVGNQFGACLLIDCLGENE